MLKSEEPMRAYASLHCRACIIITTLHSAVNLLFSKQNTSCRRVTAFVLWQQQNARLYAPIGFRQLFFRRIGQEMGIRMMLGEKLWKEFMRDVNAAAKDLWHPAFLSDKITCAGTLDGPSCPIQAAGIELRLEEIDVDHL